jgi:hypothetical protein
LKKHLPRERPLWRFEKREQQGIFAFGGQRDRRAVRIDEATGATFKRPAVNRYPPSPGRGLALRGPFRAAVRWNGRAPATP